MTATSLGSRGLRGQFAPGVRQVGIVGMCLALLLSACTPSATGPVPAAPVSTTDTSRLVVGIGTLAAQKWEPWLVTAEEAVIHMTAERLTRVNPKTGVVEGGLAESWSLTPDLKTWTFKLKPNIPFQDGYGNVTAEDVKFSWEQFTQKDSNQSRAPILRQAVDGDMKNFAITGPLEFKVTTTKPVIFLPEALSDLSPGLAIQSKKYWETKPAEARVHPLGTGPFKFVSSTTGVEVQLQAVEKHYRQTPAFKALTLKIIADDAARLAQVASGTVDFAAIPPKLLGEAKAAGLKILSIPDTAAWSIIFGGMFPGNPNYTPDAPWIQASSPEKGLAIRQAISYAIDRKTILDKVMSGEGTLTHAPFFEFPSNPQLVDPSWTLPVYDVAKAKQLLAQGGYPNGFEVTVPINPITTPGTPDMAEAVAGYFEAIGLKVKRLTSDNSVVRPLLTNETIAGWLIAYGFESRDIVQSIQNNYTLQSNSIRLLHPAIDAAYARMNRELDPSKRYAIAREMMTALIKDQAGAPLFAGGSPYAAGKKIGGWTPLPGLNELNNLEYLTAR